MNYRKAVCLFVCASLLILGLCTSVMAQANLATVSGRVFDPNAAVIIEATVTAKNVDEGIETVVRTNEEGIYVLSNLAPGNYEFTVSKHGFKVVLKPGVVLHVADTISMNFTMQVGNVNETVTVEGGAPLVNTESGTVSTIVDHEFVENLPINGRSFQTLISLSPGVVLAPASFADPGQFSTNGQRTSANYFSVDGVSANVGVQPIGSGLSQTAGGSIPGFGVTGGTNSLVSEDALEEFRIETSTYAPEFGRTPGAQVAIATRSGKNTFHGTLYEFLRNDKLDANDWFADRDALSKPEERINDFGGVLGGPIHKDRTFFFVSYEGQRLRLPQTASTLVPSLSARQNASAALKPFLNAYPAPNGPETLTPCNPSTDPSCPPSGQMPSGTAPFDASFSNQSSLDAGSVRIDHTFNSHLNVFGRYVNAPSDALQRGRPGNTVNTLFHTEINLQTFTAGATWGIGPVLSDDFRFNYSRAVGKSSNSLDTFGGAVVPSDSVLFPSPFTSADASYGFVVLPAQANATWLRGAGATNLQRQINFVDSVAFQKGAHSLKFGVDFRRLTPEFDPAAYAVSPVFFGLSSANAGTPFGASIISNTKGAVSFKNLGMFAQDTWHANPRLSLTFGLRWDIDFTPSTIEGPPLAAVTNFNDLATLSLAPSGTPIYGTKYTGFAPRVGAAYKLRQSASWETVLRGGFGVFFDLASTQVGDAISTGAYPFGLSEFLAPAPSFPFDPAAVQAPPITPASLQSGTLIAFDPNLSQPRTYQWNATLEQALGNSQAISFAYIGAQGRDLLQQESVLSPNPNIAFVELVRNAATSDYHSLQTQYQRRMSKGLQALVSYTFSHSIDTGSSSSTGLSSNAFVRGQDPNANRGPSDFDARHIFSAAVAYDIPVVRGDSRVLRAIASGWSIDNIITARSAMPVNVLDNNFLGPNFNISDVRPDVVLGQSFYVSQCVDPVSLVVTRCPGGKGLNFAAFTDPPIDPSTGFTPLRQGDLGRNALRGFGAWQWDFAFRREFHLRESLRLQFRSEFFNILNHPNFANPNSDLALGDPGLNDPSVRFGSTFGQSTQMLGRGLSGSITGTGGFASVFQVGGPRSVQFALKLLF